MEFVPIRVSRVIRGPNPVSGGGGTRVLFSEQKKTKGTKAGTAGHRRPRPAVWSAKDSGEKLFAAGEPAATWCGGRGGSGGRGPGADFHGDGSGAGRRTGRERFASGSGRDDRWEILPAGRGNGQGGSVGVRSG